MTLSAKEMIAIRQHCLDTAAKLTSSHAVDSRNGGAAGIHIAEKLLPWILTGENPYQKNTTESEISVQDTNPAQTI
jgi:hypothetical protein